LPCSYFLWHLISQHFKSRSESTDDELINLLHAGLLRTANRNQKHNGIRKKPQALALTGTLSKLRLLFPARREARAFEKASHDRANTSWAGRRCRSVSCVRVPAEAVLHSNVWDSLHGSQRPTRQQKKRQRVPDVGQRSRARELADDCQAGGKVSLQFSRMRGRTALHG